LWDVFKTRAGLEKLRREKPSTAAFGNADVMRCFLESARELGRRDSSEEYSYTARVAIGVKTKHRRALDVAISKKERACSSAGTSLESPASETEWEGLRALFCREDVFLVSHHKNHYAPVYALRESSAMDPVSRRVKHTREMLTARRGQRPSAWIDWEESRETMIGWSGYAIMAFERKKIDRV
jgi:hypothetical protein